MTDARYRVALLGAGRIGLTHAKVLNAFSADIELAVAADPDPVARRAADNLFGATAANWESVVEDESIDALLVCSATPSHEAQVLSAIAAGKSVFCEKPLADTLGGALRCAEAADREGVSLQVGFNRRFDPSFAALARAIREGRAGTVLSVCITSRDPEPPPPSYPRGERAIYFDSSCHDFDMARYLVGEDVEAVASFGAARFDEGGRASGDLDTVCVLLRFGSGVVGRIETCRTSAVGYDQRAEVHGTRATLRVDNFPSLQLECLDGRGHQRAVNPHFFVERYAEAYRAQLASFVRVLSGATPEVGGHDGCAAIALAEAAALAQRENRVVSISEVTVAVLEDHNWEDEIKP